MMRPDMRRQRGATLLVGLVMLVLMTLFAVSVFNLGRSNLQIVANTQYRNEALHAADDALQEVISKTDFTLFPPVPLLSSGSNTKTYDVNGDGVADVSVAIGSTANPARPTCIKAHVIQNASLNPFQSNAANAANDAGCMAELQQLQGLTGVPLICAQIANARLTATGEDLVALDADAASLGCSASVIASPGASLCADTLWDIRATATDVVTQATVVSNVGASIRVASASIATACP
jgi:hypothetical protein